MKDYKLNELELHNYGSDLNTSKIAVITEQFQICIESKAICKMLSLQTKIYNQLIIYMTFVGLYSIK